MNAAERAKKPLGPGNDPFMPGIQSLRIGRPLQKAFSETLHQISLQAPLVLVVGGAGTGKTLLSDMVSRACSEMGLSVQCIARGDMAHWMLGERPDVLLVDEADSVADSFLEAFSSDGRTSAARTTVFLGLPACTARFDLLGLHPVVVELTSLTPLAARSYLLEMATSAGFADLFAADALDRIVQDSRGAPRLLRSMASFAFFVASSDGVSQISLKHVGHPWVPQVRLGAKKAGENQTGSYDIETLDKDPNSEHTPSDYEDKLQDPYKDETPVEVQRDPSPLDTEKLDGDTLAVPSDVPRLGAFEQDAFVGLDAHTSGETAQLVREDERPVEGPREAFLQDAEKADDATLSPRREDETLVKGREEAFLRLDAENEHERTPHFRRERDAPAEDQTDALDAYETEEPKPLLLREDEALVESHGNQWQAHLQSDRAPTGQRKTRRRQSDDSRVRPRELIIIAAIVIATSFAFVSVLPSILTRTSPQPAAGLRALPAPLQPLESDDFGFVTPAPVPASGVTPAIAPPASSAAAVTSAPAPVPAASPASVLPTASEAGATSASNKLEGSARTEERGDDPGGAGELLLPSANGRAAGRSALTEAEKRAIARGIQELERADAQAKANAN